MGKCSEGACSSRRLVWSDTIDATNRINPCDPRDLCGVAGQTSSEIVASHAIGATLLKAFNTVPMAWIADASPSKPKTVLFVSGDDANAKSALSEVLEEVGFAAVDVGSLAIGGSLQQVGGPLAALNLVLMDRFVL